MRHCKTCPDHWKTPMSDPLSVLKTAMDMYQAQYSATDMLWAYFSTVSLALVAYTISSDKVTRLFPEATLAVCVYIVFCVGNFAALTASQKQLQALAALVLKHGAEHEISAAAFPVFSAVQVGSFYWGVVGVISVGSLGLAWHRARRRPSNPNF